MINEAIRRGGRGAALALLAMVAAANSAGAQPCPGDVNGDGRVTIDEIVQAVNSALDGCDGAVRTSPPTPVRTATPTPDASQRLVDNGDGTITDRDSGLMWEKKVGLNGVPGGPHDADNDYPWAGVCSPITAITYCQPDAASAAACTNAVDGDPAGCGQCSGRGQTCVSLTSQSTNFTTIWQWVAQLNSSNFAGHSDWRIPRLDELASINDRLNYYSSGFSGSGPFNERDCNAGCTDASSATCSCTKLSNHYWSSTTFESGSAWLIFPASQPSSTYHNLFNLNAFARAVRGGS